MSSEQEALRRHRRYPVNLVAEVRVPGWDEVLQLATGDLSRGGLFFCSERPMTPGTRLSVTLNLPEGAELTVEGEVVRVVPAGADEPEGFGVRFDERHATDLELLAAMAAANLGGRTRYELSEASHVALPTVLLDRSTATIESITAYQPVEPARPVEAPAEEQGYEVALPPAPAIDAPIERMRRHPNRPSVAPDEDPIFGIDFGTSFSSIALPGPRGIHVLEDAEGNTMFPSVVCYQEDDVLVGWNAKQQIPFYPSTTFVSPKRLLGRQYSDSRIASFLDASPVRFLPGRDGEVAAEIYGQSISMTEVAAEVFRHLMAVGEEASGMPVRRAVVSAPVHYRAERPAIQAAGEAAGLEVLRVIDEPVAAAMAFGLGREDVLAAIYDFGGGTFDFTLVSVRDGRFEVVRRAGDAWLGGDDFDRALAHHAAATFQRQHGVDLRERKVEWQRLLLHCEAAKRKLSFQQRVDLRAGAMVLSVRGPIDLHATFDRALLAELCGDLVDQSIASVDVCLEAAGFSPADVNAVVVVGGTCRIPLVRERLGEFFGHEIQLPVDPEHVVVVGDAVAARYAALQGVRKAR